MIPEPAALGLSSGTETQKPQDLLPARGTTASAVCPAPSNHPKSILGLSGLEQGSAALALEEMQPGLY